MVERELIETILHHTEGNHSEAARILGIDRKTLSCKMRELGVSRDGPACRHD